MTNTTNYNLNIFEATDTMKPTTLNGLNENSTIIDGALSTLNGKIINTLTSNVVVGASEQFPLTEGIYYTGGYTLQIGSSTFSGLFEYQTVGYNGLPTVIYLTGNTLNELTVCRYSSSEWTRLALTKTDTISSSSTSSQIPSAEAVYNYVDSMITSAIGGSY